MIFNGNIKEIERRIGYTFRDKSLLRQAFTRASYSNEHRDRRGRTPQSNEVLEFFGDSLLSAAIVTLLMRDQAKRYEFGISTELAEGDFSNIKSKLSDKRNLSLTVEKLGLQKFLLLGEGDAKLGIENEPSVMEDLFESIIGAIYIDSDNNISEVISSVSKMLDVGEYLSEKGAPIQSFKNALQEWCADKKHRRENPVYKTVSETGPDHKKIYERACYIGGRVYGIGQGKNQKLADAKAAEEALTALINEEERRIADKLTAESALSLKKLKEYAAREKKPSPEFRDLGESTKSRSGKTEYEVECRFAGLCAVGAAPDKHEAKAIAADKLLKLLGNENDKKKSAQKASSRTAKKSEQKTVVVKHKVAKKAQKPAKK